ncbi:MAG: hypothetical protein ABEK50_07935 [bacterium]
MTNDKTAVSLPLPALNPSDVLAEPVTVNGYTLYPKQWELSQEEIETLQDWGQESVKVYADPTVNGINMMSSPSPRKSSAS